MSVVVIPAFRPDQTLVSLTDQLWARGIQIIVVDDGSGPEYASIFEQISDVCMILRHSKKQGKEKSVRTALSFIKRELPGTGCVGIMDADGQCRIKDMQRLLEYARNHRDALVLGVREGGRKRPVISRLAFRLCGSGTGLWAFDASLVEKILSTEGNRMDVREQIPVEEVPLLHDEVSKGLFSLCI